MKIPLKATAVRASGDEKNIKKILTPNYEKQVYILII